MEDRPGTLRDALRILSDAKISVEYVYAFLNKEVNIAYIILRVEDNDTAQTALKAGGVRVLEGEDIN